MIYQAMAEELFKIASEKKDEKKKVSPIGVGGRMIGATALGAGLGTGVGYGAGMLANHFYKKHTGQDLPMKYIVPAGTFLGGMSGLLMEHARKKNLEDVKRVIKDQ